MKQDGNGYETTMHQRPKTMFFQFNELTTQVVYLLNRKRPIPYDKLERFQVLKPISSNVFNTIHFTYHKNSESKYV